MRREDSVFLYTVMILLVVGLAVLVFFNYRANADQQEAIAQASALAAVTPSPAPTPSPEPTPVPERTTETVTLAFSGDLIGQPGLTTEARSGDAERGFSYDYSDELAGVEPSLAGADFAACTLVGTLSSGGTYDEGYELNDAMAAALAGAGFRLVNLATDHILDRGLDGLVETVETVTGEGMAVSGAYASAQLHGAYMVELGGVKLAVLGYTYGTGGVSVADNAWCVDLLTQDYMTGQSTVDYERIDADVAAVRDAGADIVACFVYWWDNAQYYTAPRDSQTEVVEHLFQSGVDIVLGGGIKTPQPIVTQVVERADGKKANCVALYSLSNLMSCFSDRYTNLSATARIELSRDVDTGEVWVSAVRYIPLFMLDTDDYDDYDEPGYKFRLLDAYDAIAGYEAGGGDITAETYDALLTGVEDLRAILGAEYDTQAGGVSLSFPY